MRNNPIIIIDGNFIAHTCRFTGKVYHEGEECGVIKTLLDYILDLSQSYKTNNFVIAWDSRHSFRKKKYPWYKSKRTKDRQELSEEEKKILRSMYRQIDILQVCLKELGFENNIEQNGLEGDDVMAMVCRNYPTERIILVASDHDLWQLLDHNVSMLTPKGDYLGKEYRAKDFEKEWGIPPQKWFLVKAIAGCSIDEVPGVGRDIHTGEIVARIGESTAANFLIGKMNSSTGTYKRIISDEANQIKKRNLELVRLPHERTKPIILKENHYDWEKFQKICKTYSFKDFLGERVDEWMMFFDISE